MGKTVRHACNKYMSIKEQNYFHAEIGKAVRCCHMISCIKTI